MNKRTASLGEALTYARQALPSNVDPIDVFLKNGSTVTAIGDLMMIDDSTTGVDLAGNYFRVIDPTVAGNLAAAGFTHVVAQEVIAAGKTGRFRLYGDTIMRFSEDAATVGTKLGTNGTARTLKVTSVVTLTKFIAKSKVAVVFGTQPNARVFFNGLPPGLAIAP